MGKQTFLWLVVLVAALAGVVLWQQSREKEQGLGLTDIALFEGLDPARVSAFVVDHLERGYQLRLERDERGIWYITDPILSDADLGIVKLLLETVVESRALFVPEEERDAGALGLDPPRAIFTVEELVDGEKKRHTVELGLLDIDGQRLNVRKDGRLLRILRKLDSALKRSVNDFRSPRVVNIVGSRVTALNRWGSLQEDLTQEPLDLTLNAVRDGDTWRSLVPYSAALDPLDFTILLFGSGGLRIDRFVDDIGTDLARYGLDEPTMGIELVTSDGAREELLFGRTGGGVWHVKRKGAENVYGVAGEDMLRLLMPYEQLVETRVLRVDRTTVDALRLESPAGEVGIVRDGEGWSVLERPAGGEWSAAFPAELARVEQLFGEIEHLELAGLALNDSFPSDAPRRGLYVEIAGQELGGRIGPESQTDDGSPALMFQRLGDDITSLAPLELLGITSATAAEFRSMEIATITEVEVQGLELSHAGDTLKFTRGDRGRWTRDGADGEAVELLPLLDALLFLRAEAHDPPGSPALEDVIELRFDLRDGAAPLSLRIGRGAEGVGSRVELAGARARLRVSDLHERLAALFGG